MKQLLEKFGIDHNADLVTIHGELLKLQFLYSEALKNADDDRKEDISKNLQELQQAVATITILLDNVEKSQQYEYDFEESEKAFLATDYVDLFGLYPGMSRENMEEQIDICSQQCQQLSDSDNQEVIEKANQFLWTLNEAKGLMQVSKAFVSEEQLYGVMKAYLSISSIKGVDRSKVNMLFMGAFQKNLECIKTIGNLCFINHTFEENANGWLKYAAENEMIDSYFLYGNALAADKKFEEAIHWYDLYAESGKIFNMEEKSALGMAYLMAKEYEKGYPYVSEAASAGHSNAMVGMGAMYECGEIVEQDFEKALEMYEKAKINQMAAGEDLTVVNRSIDRVRIAIADMKSGFDWMNISMKKLFGIHEKTSDKQIFDKVALIQNTYEKLSVISDAKKAERAKRIVCAGTEIKNIMVQQNLPEMEGGKVAYINTCLDIMDQLYNREGFPVILKQFRKALTGDSECLENTGFVCYFGFKDEERANDWIKAAVNAGSHTARLKYAVAMQKNGDFKGACNWFQAAEEAGELDSAELYYSYGICAFNANKRELAANYVQKAASGNYRAAILTMGAFYEDGCGVSKNYEKAMEFYQKAQELAVKDAQKYIDHLQAKMDASQMMEINKSVEEVRAKDATLQEDREEILKDVKKQYVEASQKTTKKKFSLRSLFGKKNKNQDEEYETV